MIDRHWVAIQCEASEATPAVADASEASKTTYKTMNAYTINITPTNAYI